MSRKEGIHVGLRERFPTRQELRALTDICEHEGLHKACPDCSVKINEIITIMAPIIRDRVGSARYSERNMR